MATPKINAMDLLKQIQNVDESSIKVQAELQAKVFAKEVEPEDPHLLHPYERNYVTGVEIKTPNGKGVTPASLASMLKDYQVNLCLVGPAGSGKSALGFHVVDLVNDYTRKENALIRAKNIKLKAAGEELEPYVQLKYPLWHVSCHEATRSEDLTVSTKVMVENGIAKSDEILGAALSAYTQGGILVIEEPDHSMPGVTSEIHQLLDGRTESVMFYANGPKRYVKHPNFLGCIATQNSKGMGEAARNYAGTQMQNRAFRSRFGFTVEVPFLPSSVEIQVLEKLGLPTGMAQKMVGIANRIRQAASVSKEFDMEFSLRDLKHWGKATLMFCEGAGIKPDAHRAWDEALNASYPAFLSREDELTQQGVFKYVNIA